MPPLVLVKKRGSAQMLLDDFLLSVLMPTGKSLGSGGDDERSPTADQL